MSRVLFLMPTKTYRAGAFLAAAEKLGMEAVVASEKQQALESLTAGKTLTVDFNAPQTAVRAITEFARTHPLDAIIPVDDETAVLAALACEALALPGNPPESVRATRLKHLMRERLRAAAQPVPEFQVFSTREDPEELATRATYPCVLKPVFLSASRGVIRVDDEREFVGAFNRIVALLKRPELRDKGAELILAEEYIPGEEVALEGILIDGRLKVLAIFDKPDPLQGPYFAETIYVTPSRRPIATQQNIRTCVANAASALGLRHGPVHAELRLNPSGVWLLEIAARSIGGLCSRALRFGETMSLEEVILLHATGESIDHIEREKLASGVMMIPIPKGGILKSVSGLELAKGVANIEEIRITIPVEQELVPLPEGDRYLGFIFARHESPEGVEAAIRKAYGLLEFEVASG